MTLNDAFKALADPTRRKILDLLKHSDLTAGEISEHFEMSKPSISNHLSLLKQAHLVWVERRGYRLFPKYNRVSGCNEVDYGYSTIERPAVICQGKNN